MRQETRVQTLFHSMACEATTQGDRISEVLVANTAGLCRVQPKVVIDRTGDADIATRAGAPVEKAVELQPMSLHFQIGNVRQSAVPDRLL